jgi:tyrosine-protein kinase Etk/Wzc
MSNASNTIIQDNNSKLSAKEIFFKYLVYLPLFVICLGVSVTIAYIYIRYKVPVYSSSISLLIKDAGGRNSGGGSDEMMLEDVMLYKKRANLANEIEVVKSTSMMERVVNSLGLNVQYYTEGQVKKSEIYADPSIKAEILSIKDSSQGISAILKPGNKSSAIVEVEGKKFTISNGDIINSSAGSFRISFKPELLSAQNKYFISWRSVKSVAAGIAAGLDIKQLNRDASILKINIQTEIPQKGKDILNQLVIEYRQTNIDDKNKVVDNTIQFIDERISLLSDELGKVEGGMQTYQQENNIVNPHIQGDIELQEFKAAKDKLEEEEIRLQVIKMIREYLSNPSKRFQLVPSSLGIADPTLLSLVNSYNELQLKREEALKTVQHAHPSIGVLEGQIEKVRINMIENLSNINLSVQNVASKLRGDYNLIRSKLSSIPRQQREVLEITRQKEIKQKLYLFLLQKREESAITRAAAVGSSKAIDAAVASRFPVSPNTTNIYRIAFVLGILLPIAFIYIRDILNDKVVTRTDLTKGTASPIVGEVAHHTSMTRKFVVGMKDRSILAEQFRIIRTNLQFLLAHTPSKNPVILVTSSIAGEGKTFSSMNLAAVWAVAGKKTVILELDLRKPKISKALNLRTDKGITNYILGNASKEELPQLLPDVPNLYVVAAGPIPPNPSEMIMDDRMGELFTYLRANFDIIIIDSAPIGLVSDSKILSKYADATVYVVRQRYTVKKQLSFVNDLYTQKILPNMGLLVNDVKIGGANSYYGYGYGYGYGYSYNYSYNYNYGEDVKKKGIIKKIRGMVGM